MTSFISKIAKKLSIGGSRDENNSFEETKFIFFLIIYFNNPFFRTPSVQKKEPHSSEKNLNKLNVNSVYNNTEEYKPVVLDPSQHLSDSLTTKDKFKELFSSQIIDYEKLKQFAWDGIPSGEYKH